jgi:hypothetical protein
MGRGVLKTALSGVPSLFANLLSILTQGPHSVALPAMKIRLLCFSAFCSGAILLSGCVNTIDGRQKVGLPLVKDTVTARYERAPSDIWAAAKDVLKYNGTLYSEDTLQSTLEASVDTKTVWVKIEPVDQRLTKVTVQVRTKGGGADLPLASEIDKEIAIRLVTGNLTPATKPNPGLK